MADHHERADLAGSPGQQAQSGRHYTEDATISPVRDATGVITGFVGVKRDITQQLELEAQLRQAQRMRASGVWRVAWRTTSTTCSR